MDKLFCNLFGHKWEWFLYKSVLGKMPHHEYAECKRCKKQAWSFWELHN